MYLAEFAEQKLRAHPQWEITTPAKMAIVTFRYVPDDLRGAPSDNAEAAKRIDAINRNIASRMQEQAFALVLSTGLRGKTVLRLCTINPRTTESDIGKTVENLTENARKAAAAFG
jgi:glutamate/tyrosine decarboxylase-like PLP-dependent enzyme